MVVEKRVLGSLCCRRRRRRRFIYRMSAEHSLTANKKVQTEYSLKFAR